MKNFLMKVGSMSLLIFASATSIACTQEYTQFEFPVLEKTANEPLILGPAGETFEFIQTGEKTCDKFLFAKLTVPPSFGPPPHIHHWTDEWFYAPNGGITIMMGEGNYPDIHKYPGHGADKTVLHMIQMRPKELFYGPRFMVHGFLNHTNKPATLYLVWRPDRPDMSILPYFKRSGTIRDLNNPNPQPSTMAAIRFVSMAPEYGINQSTNFWEYVDKVVEDKAGTHMMDNHQQELLNLIEDSRACQKGENK